MLGSSSSSRAVSPSPDHSRCHMNRTRNNRLNQLWWVLFVLLLAMATLLVLFPSPELRLEYPWAVAVGWALVGMRLLVALFRYQRRKSRRPFSDRGAQG